MLRIELTKLMPADHLIFASSLIAAVSFLYATAGQAGGTAFLAIMAFAGFAPGEMRPLALLLNVVAAGYATWHLSRRAAIDWAALRLLLPPSLITAFIGGLIALQVHIYFLLTGTLLIAASALLVFKRTADLTTPKPIAAIPAALVGAGAGLLSGLSGVGGGVFLVPPLVALSWKSPKAAATLSPPFILGNSILGLIGALLSGQHLAGDSALYCTAAFGGAVVGTAIGARWMSERATSYVLALILAFAGVRLLLR